MSNHDWSKESVTCPYITACQENFPLLHSVTQTSRLCASSQHLFSNNFFFFPYVFSGIMRSALTCSGVVDSLNIAELLEYKQKSLTNLCGQLLGHGISKRCQMSDWQASPLSSAQVQYAATDAWASRAVHVALSKAQIEAGRVFNRPKIGRAHV